MIKGALMLLPDTKAGSDDGLRSERNWTKAWIRDGTYGISRRRQKPGQTPIDCPSFSKGL
jgi:hypothetical protein